MISMHVGFFLVHINSKYMRRVISLAFSSIVFFKLGFRKLTTFYFINTFIHKHRPIRESVNFNPI